MVFGKATLIAPKSYTTKRPCPDQIWEAFDYPHQREQTLPYDWNYDLSYLWWDLIDALSAAHELNRTSGPSETDTTNDEWFEYYMNSVRQIETTLKRYVQNGLLTAIVSF